MVATKTDTNGQLLCHVRNDQAGHGYQLQGTRKQVVDWNRTRTQKQLQTIPTIRPSETFITREAVNELQHLERVHERMKGLSGRATPADSCTEAARWLADTMDLTAALSLSEPPHGPPTPGGGAGYIERLVPRRPERYSADMRHTLGSTSTNWPYPITGPVDGSRPESCQQTWRGPRALNEARCRYISSMSLKHCDGDGSGRFRDGLSGSIRAGFAPSGPGGANPFDAHARASSGAAVFRGTNGQQGGPMSAPPMKRMPGAVNCPGGVSSRGPAMMFR